MATRVPRCPFCEIAHGMSEGRTASVLFQAALTEAERLWRALMQDDQVIAFQDRSPSAFRHYLVIPMAHVKNVKHLKKSEEDHALVALMWKIGQSLLERDAPNAQHRFGFHKPPFNSVDHLHLHCLALPYISWWRALKYTSLGFLGAYVSVEKVLQQLDGGGNKDTSTEPPV